MTGPGTALAGREAGAGGLALRSLGLRRLAAALTATAVLSLFALSPMLLLRLGLSYDRPGGGALEKIHPGSLVALAALAIYALSLERPLRLAGRLVRDCTGAAFFASTWLFLLVYILLVQKVPFTPIIDTFLLPLALFVLLVVAGLRSRALGVALHAVFALNAALGLAEVATGWRLTPFVAGGIEITGDWRATALFGHPLSNASLAGAYVLTLATGGANGLPRLLRGPALALQLVSMLAFGGRAALVLTLAGLALIGLVGFVRLLRGRRVRVTTVAGAALLLPVAAGAALALLETTLFARMIERFASDQGSAEARVLMFELFNGLSWSDVLFGPDPDVVAHRLFVENLVGIESFWVAFVLTYGLGVSLIFFAGLAAFCAEIVRAAGRPALVPLAFFFAVASTSVSLSAKSALLAMLVALVLTLYPPAPAARVQALRS